MIYKAPLTSSFVSQFINSFQSVETSKSPAEDNPYVYVDQNQVKFVTSVVSDSENQHKTDVFAISVAGDGWVELLAIGQSDE